LQLSLPSNTTPRRGKADWKSSSLYSWTKHWISEESVLDPSANSSLWHPLTRRFWDSLDAIAKEKALILTPITLRNCNINALKHVYNTSANINQCSRAIIAWARNYRDLLTVKNAVFWDVTPCGSCKNQCFGGTYRLHHQGDKNRRARNNVLRLLLTVKVVPSSPIIITPIMEATRSSETTDLTRATQPIIPERHSSYSSPSKPQILRLLTVFIFNFELTHLLVWHLCSQASSGNSAVSAETRNMLHVATFFNLHASTYPITEIYRKDSLLKFGCSG
jgi:hypothetical protein